MNKHLVKAFMLSAVAAMACGCPNNGGGGGGGNTGRKANITYWGSFGSALTTTLDTLIEEYNETVDKYTVEHISHKSYKDIKKDIDASIGTQTYPNFANGYPDHFAKYISHNIMLSLGTPDGSAGYAKSYADSHQEYMQKLGVTNLFDDYYEEYMDEVKALKYDDAGNPYVMGLPFNKSTELLGYNVYMLDYLQQVDPTIELPKTYAEWATTGVKIKDIVLRDLAGKKLTGKVDGEHATDMVAIAPDAEPTDGRTVIADMKDVDESNFTVLSWDALDNMFITLVRQYGGQYTSYTQADMALGHGWATFWDNANKAATRAAMEMVIDLHNKGIFKMPLETSDKSFASNNFKQYMTFAMVCSSGGLSNNIDPAVRLGLAEIPYADASRKYVISQGTNLGLFDQGTDDEVVYSFETMVALTTGDIQGEWAAISGYYPSSKSAYNSEVYQNLLNNPVDPADKQFQLKRAYKESAVVNSSKYMDKTAAQRWYKYTDPGFVGSSEIRDAAATIVPELLKKDAKNIDDTMTAVLSTIQLYVKK